jgi:FkbM family methyltransferase
LEYPWSITDRIVRSRYGAWFSEGVITDTRGCDTAAPYIADNRGMPRRPITAALRNSVRGTLRRGGFDIVRYDESHSPEVRRARLIEERGIDLVLDVGANTGPSALALRGAGYAGRIVSFEPQSAAYDALEAACRSDAEWECRKIAVGAADGEAELHVSGNSSSSSLLDMEGEHLSAAPESQYVASECVAVRRLDSLRHDLVRPNDRVYLKLDVQGLELDALRGAEETLTQTSIVESELSLAPLYHGAPDLMEVVNYLADRGFNLLALEPVFVDPHDGRLLQVDGLFARPHG